MNPSTPEKRGPGRPRDVELPARRREQILRSAAELFARNGYRNTEVQTIADHLGVAKGTIYNYFESKRTLFLATVDQGMRELSAQVHGATDDESDPIRRITVGVQSYLAFFDEHPLFVELLIQERAEFKDRTKPTYFQHRDANIDRWREYYQSLIDRGLVRDIPVDRILDVINDLLYGTIFTNYHAGRRQSLQRQAQDILDVFFHGILTPTNKPPDNNV